MALNTLPSELLHHILSYLDIPSLLSFSLTSHTNHTHHLLALHTLNLAVFPKKVQSLISFLQHFDCPSTGDASGYNPFNVAITIPSNLKSQTAATAKSHRHSVIAQQNASLTPLLARYGTSLRALSFHAWDITSGTATALATQTPHLQHLSLLFDHSSSRDPCIPPTYFDGPTRASSLWNALAGLGIANDEKLRLRSLQSLRLERAGCTSAQLRGFVGRNPRLKELRLRKVKGVDAEFLKWLGSTKASCRENLEVLCLDDCPDLELSKGEQYAWLTGLKGLKELRIAGPGCVGVGEKEVRSLIANHCSKEMKIEILNAFWDEVGVVSDGGAGESEGKPRSVGEVLEVDEACL